MKTCVVTSFFNPNNYRNRIDNYKLFRDNLQIPLLTVYLDLDGSNQLSSKDADMFVKVVGTTEKNILWQKEALLNIGVKNLPSDVENVIFLDCDVIFEDQNWVDKVEKTLQVYNILQPFSECVRLPKDADLTAYYYKQLPIGIDNDCRQPSLTSMLNKNLNELAIPLNNRPSLTGHPGFGVAIKREILDEVGLYDLCILGSGDTVLMNSSIGRKSKYPFITSTQHQEHFDDWFNFWSSAINRKIGNVSGSRLYHLWHGSIQDRQYRTRYSTVFKDYQLDPNIHIKKDEQGLLAWTGDSEVYTRICDYFTSRKEDG